MIQERAREFAVIESIDGGKTIRESRDVDIPLAANHFFYYAGWADKLEYAFPGRVPSSLGVAGQIIPWNFPLLMAAWKIAPALATGNTVVLKPAETTPLTALLLAEVISEAGLAPGVGNIVTGAGGTGSGVGGDRFGARRTPGGRQDRVHGLDGGRQAHSARDGGDRQTADARARGQGREHRLRGRAARPGRRGRDQRDLLQPGARVLRGLAAAGRGVRGPGPPRTPQGPPPGASAP